ncbi:MAG TPA: polysaccharide deacetylase family protein [Candidatus Binatia bacterium]|nr:polysaccharide deacetylase family protein [Candidatus Binatia bacterium]
MESDIKRRDFLKQGLLLAGTASVLASGLAPKAAFAQTQGKSVRRADRYEDSFIFERKPFKWPGNKTLAVWIAPNVEVWHYDSPAGQAPSPNVRNIVPDVINYAWREYGMRVGLWRIADTLDAAGVKATVALNSAVAEAHPKALEEMKRRGWEFMGHGITNSENLAGLNLEKERELIQTVLKTIEQATGQRPRGWLGSGLAETYNTLDILAEEGVIYCGDWNNDDQPYPMKVKKGRMFSIPYCMEINDIPLFIRKGYTGEQYFRSVVDQFDTLYTDSAKQPRVMGIPLHPMIVGQPLRIKYLQRALAHIKKHERVWFATGGEIIDAYQRANPVG